MREENSKIAIYWNNFLIGIKMIDECLIGYRNLICWEVGLTTESLFADFCGTAIFAFAKMREENSKIAIYWNNFLIGIKMIDECLIDY